MLLVVIVDEFVAIFLHRGHLDLVPVVQFERLDPADMNAHFAMDTVKIMEAGE